MRRPRIQCPRILSLCVAAASFAATGTRSEASELPNPANWTPAAATLIAYVDWQTLRSSPPLRGLDKQLTGRDPWKELEELRELTGMDPWRDMWAFSFFKVSTKESSSWGLAIYGALDRERILDGLSARGKLKHTEHRKTEVYLYDFTADGPEGLAFPDDTTLLLGPVSQVRSMLDAGLGFAPTAADGELGSALEKLSMGETLWAVGKDASKLPVVFARGTAPNTGVALRSFTISAKFGLDVRFEALGETSSRKNARSLADLLKGLRAFTALQPSGAGLMDALQTLDVDTLDRSVTVSGEIDGKFLGRFLERSLEKQ